MASGSAVTFTLQDVTCGVSYLSTDPNHAHIGQLSNEEWFIEWDDNSESCNPANRDYDYNDLITVIGQGGGGPNAVFETLGGGNASEAGSGSNPSGGLAPVQIAPQCGGNYPVNCATGDFYHSFTDFSIPGRGPALNLSRTYNSLASLREGIFGFGWSSSYDMSLTVEPKSGTVTVNQENGAAVSFLPTGSGGYRAPVACSRPSRAAEVLTPLCGTIGRRSRSTVLAS